MISNNLDVYYPNQSEILVRARADIHSGIVCSRDVTTRPPRWCLNDFMPLTFGWRIMDLDYLKLQQVVFSSWLCSCDNSMSFHFAIRWLIDICCRGFLKSDKQLGVVNIKLQPLEDKCIFHDSYDVWHFMMYLYLFLVVNLVHGAVSQLQHVDVKCGCGKKRDKYIEEF